MPLTLEERLSLIKSVGEEIVSEDELKQLLQAKKNPIAYDGFEPSGKVHIAQGLLRAININKMTKAGVKFKMFVADWHAWANNKLGGNLENIQTAGKYMIEVWKACGMDLKNVKFVWASDLVNDENYWKKVMNVARDTTMARVLRTTQIMGRSETETLSAAQILYPCMQAADIFHLEADITQLGMDQRKVNMLAREIGPKLGFWKPVVVSHHMLAGLGQPPAADLPAEEKAMAMKMSKSKPETAIFMTDSAEEVQKKISKAYCPERLVIGNPIMEYMKYIVFERYPIIKIQRPEKFGGNLEVDGYEALKHIYELGELHPSDLKNTCAKYINEMLEPVRKHFETDKKAKELKKQLDSFSITR
jgi:tyrosyl-tRNA synthetase